METIGAETRSCELTELVLYQGEIAKRSHKRLFSLGEACYRSAGDHVVSSLMSTDLESVSRLHISAGWEAMIAVALWKPGELSFHEVIPLLKKAGIADDSLSVFAGADVRDILPWLYYGKRFDVLRKVCSAAKAKVEANLERKKMIVYCHLVYEEAESIVASNL